METLSSTKFEYVALTEVVKEAIWLQGIVGKFGLNVTRVHIHCDSHSAICISKVPMFHEYTKHVYVKLYFSREIIENFKVNVVQLCLELLRVGIG